MTSQLILPIRVRHDRHQESWFRALPAAFAQPAPAQTVAGMSILLLTLYTGYTIPQPSVIGKWITYINVRSPPLSFLPRGL